MNALLRITTMVAVSEITLAVIAAGFDFKGMIFASFYIIFFCTLPLIVIISIFHMVEFYLGVSGMFLILMVGSLPTVFIFVVVPAMGIAGGFNDYAQSICIAGWLWSAAWILTSQRLRSIFY